MRILATAALMLLAVSLAHAQTPPPPIPPVPIIPPAPNNTRTDVENQTLATLAEACKLYGFSRLRATNGGGLTDPKTTEASQGVVEAYTSPVCSHPEDHLEVSPYWVRRNGDYVDPTMQALLPPKKSP